MSYSWLSPKTEVRESPIHGRGLFARGPFAKDEIVAVKGGRIMTRAQWQQVQQEVGSAEIQLSDDLFIGPGHPDEKEAGMLYSNHACDSNLGLRGDIVFVARQRIEAGEELTHDWCLTDNDDYEVECRCGSPACRRILTGQDWRRPELQQKYAGYFSAYLTQQIFRLRAGATF